MLNIYLHLLINDCLGLKNRKMKIQRNFFNLSESVDFRESIFQCQLGLSLGLTRRCYICDHYDQNILTLPDCKPSCKCRKSKNRDELVRHLCEKIFRAIDTRAQENKDVYIIAMGFKQNGGKTQIFAEYLIPFAATQQPTIGRLNMKAFVQSFQDCSGSRLKNYI